MKVTWKLFSSVRLFANPWTTQSMEFSRILEWVAIPFSRGSSQPRSPALQVDSLPTEPPGKTPPKKALKKTQQIKSAGSFWYARAKVASVVSDSLRPYGLCSPPGSSVHGILQAIILEWAAISSSRGSSASRDRTCVSCVSCIGRKGLYH